MELILSLMKRPINKPPLTERTIKQQYIKTADINLIKRQSAKSSMVKKFLLEAI